MKPIAILPCAAFFGTVVGSFQNISQDCSVLSNGICLPQSYNKLKEPQDFLEVRVKVQVEQISEIDDYLATVDLFAWLTLSWPENRLIITNQSDELPSGDHDHPDYFHLEKQWLDRLWLPDIYIMSLKELRRSIFLQSHLCK